MGWVGLIKEGSEGGGGRSGGMPSDDRWEVISSVLHIIS